MALMDPWSPIRRAAAVPISPSRRRRAFSTGGEHKHACMGTGIPSPTVENFQPVQAGNAGAPSVKISGLDGVVGLCGVARSGRMSGDPGAQRTGWGLKAVNSGRSVSVDARRHTRQLGK